MSAEDTNEIIKFEPLDSDIILQKRIKKIGNKNALISQVPNILSAQQFSGAYRIIMPPGISGQLMQYQTGGLGTAVMQNGKVVAHAKLSSMAATAAPLIIFTAMSVATGQYFLAQINQSLVDILDELRKISGLLVLKEESDLFALSIFLDKIVKDYPYITASNYLKSATLGNIQRSINRLSSSIYFYSKCAQDQAEELRNKLYDKNFTTDKIDCGIRTMVNYLKKLKTSIDLHNMFVVLEFSLAQAFDSSTIKIIKDNLLVRNEKNFASLINEVLNSIVNMQHDLLNKSNKRIHQEKRQYLVSKIKSQKLGITRNYITITNSLITSAFDRLIEIEACGMEFYVLDDGIYALDEP